MNSTVNEVAAGSGLPVYIVYLLGRLSASPYCVGCPWSCAREDSRASALALALLTTLQLELLIPATRQAAASNAFSASRSEDWASGWVEFSSAVRMGSTDAYGFTNFSLPAAIATDRNGVIWVADSLRHVVSAFRREGREVRFLDYIGAFGRRPGEFSYPAGLAASLSGRLVVVDRGGGRLQCFEQ